MTERTFVMVKPDGVQRRLAGKIIERFEGAGLKIAAIKFMSVSKELAEKHYAIHKGKPFYDGLIEYITSGPVLAMVLEGNNVIGRVRAMVGSTNPDEAMPGTIRGDYAQEIGRNIVHASDSEEMAKHEIALWFSPQEIISYKMTDEDWLFE
ncbi:MAG: nucleoside-diphosphate kinase [Candidatus Thermoplasmatota archaeon]|nr:nucleoside-diphosphate kinase [Candidatus Thermoplasmatota archaeon]